VKIDIQTSEIGPPGEPARVGFVYPIKGGRGIRYGHMQVLIAITEPREQWLGAMGLMLVINKEGKPVGVNSYGMHYIEDLQPIAFVEGIEELTLIMRSI
jgi:hypothetical protein